jgi:signal peptidase I
MTRDQSALVADAAPALFADTLRRYGRVSLRATGRSMLPAIEPGDVLRVEHATADRIQPGDVILYDAGGRLIAHRCVRISVAAGVVGLVARGDSHCWTDPPISPAQVLGRVVGIPRCSAAGHVQGAVMRIWRSLRDRAASRGALATIPAGAR